MHKTHVSRMWPVRVPVRVSSTVHSYNSYMSELRSTALSTPRARVVAPREAAAGAERLCVGGDGLVRYELKSPWRDDTTGIVLPR